MIMQQVNRTRKMITWILPKGTLQKSRQVSKPCSDDDHFYKPLNKKDGFAYLSKIDVYLPSSFEG